MTRCDHCEVATIQGVRCHERGCPNISKDIGLVDEGTLDTVFECGHCGYRERYNFDPNLDDPTDSADAYDEFVSYSFKEFEEEHECEEEEE